MKKVYEVSVEQPIIAATRCELPKIVQRLLDEGADFNSLSKNVYARIHNPEYTWSTQVKSLLDMVRDQIEQSQKYNGPRSTKLDPPAALEEDVIYLKGL
jgi:hypothetical protein